jgi:hypothetical protein
MKFSGTTEVCSIHQGQGCQNSKVSEWTTTFHWGQDSI